MHSVYYCFWKRLWISLETGYVMNYLAFYFSIVMTLNTICKEYVVP